MSKKRYLTAEELSSVSLDDDMIYELPDFSEFKTPVTEEGYLPGGFDVSGTPTAEFTPLNEDDKEFLINPLEEAYLTPEQLYERKAQDQTVLDDLNNFTWNTVVKTAQELVKIPGAIGGLMVAIATQDTEPMFNNKFNNAVDDLFDAIKADVYTTKENKEGTWYNQVLNTSFLASEGSEALGFMLSFFVGGGFIKTGLAGIGVGTKIAGLAGKVGSAAPRLAKSIGFLEAAASKASSVKKFANNIDAFGAVMVNTYAESVAEASGTYEQVYDAKKLQLLNQGIPAERADIFAKEEATKRAKKTFGANMALLALTNSVQGMNFFKEFKLGSKSMANIAAGKGTQEVLKKVGTKAATGIVSEGLVEEGSQYVFDKYYADIDNDYESKTYLNRLGNMASLYTNALTEDVEMQKSIFLGAMLGIGGGAIGGIRETQQTKDFLFGENARGRIGKSKAGQLIFGKPTEGKGYLYDTDHSMLTDFKTSSETYEHEIKDGKIVPIEVDILDKDGKPTGEKKYKASNALIQKLGADAAARFIQSQEMESAIRFNNESQFEKAKAIQEFDAAKSVFADDAATDYFIDTILEEKGKKEIEARLKAAGNEADAKKSSIIASVEKEIEAKKERLKVYKELYDRIIPNHNAKWGLESKPEDKDFADVFEKTNLNKKLEYEIIKSVFSKQKERIDNNINNTKKTLATNAIKGKDLKNNDIITDKDGNVSVVGYTKVKGKEGSTEYKLKLLGLDKQGKYTETSIIEDSEKNKDKEEDITTYDIFSGNTNALNFLGDNLAEQLGNAISLGIIEKNEYKLYDKNLIQENYNSQLKKFKDVELTNEFNSTYKVGNLFKDSLGDTYKIGSPVVYDSETPYRKKVLYKGKVGLDGKMKFTERVDTKYDLDIKNKSQLDDTFTILDKEEIGRLDEYSYNSLVTEGKKNIDKLLGEDINNINKIVSELEQFLVDNPFAEEAIRSQYDYAISKYRSLFAETATAHSDHIFKKGDNLFVARRLPQESNEDNSKYAVLSFEDYKNQRKKYQLGLKEEELKSQEDITENFIDPSKDINDKTQYLGTVDLYLKMSLLPDIVENMNNDLISSLETIDNKIDSLINRLKDKLPEIGKIVNIGKSLGLKLSDSENRFTKNDSIELGKYALKIAEAMDETVDYVVNVINEVIDIQDQIINANNKNEKLKEISDKSIDHISKRIKDFNDLTIAPEDKFNIEQLYEDSKKIYDTSKQKLNHQRKILKGIINGLTGLVKALRILTNKFKSFYPKGNTHLNSLEKYLTRISNALKNKELVKFPQHSKIDVNIAKLAEIFRDNGNLVLSKILVDLSKKLNASVQEYNKLIKEFKPLHQEYLLYFREYNDFQKAKAKVLATTKSGPKIKATTPNSYEEEESNENIKGEVEYPSYVKEIKDINEASRRPQDIFNPTVATINFATINGNKQDVLTTDENNLKFNFFLANKIKNNSEEGNDYSIQVLKLSDLFSNNDDIGRIWFNSKVKGKKHAYNKRTKVKGKDKFELIEKEYDYDNSLVAVIIDKEGNAVNEYGIPLGTIEDIVISESSQQKAALTKEYVFTFMPEASTSIIINGKERLKSKPPYSYFGWAKSFPEMLTFITGKDFHKNKDKIEPILVNAYKLLLEQYRQSYEKNLETINNSLNNNEKVTIPILGKSGGILYFEDTNNESPLLLKLKELNEIVHNKELTSSEILKSLDINVSDSGIIIVTDENGARIPTRPRVLSVPERYDSKDKTDYNTTIDILELYADRIATLINEFYKKNPNSKIDNFNITKAANYLIDENNKNIVSNDISLTINKLLGSYLYWFNWAKKDKMANTSLGFISNKDSRLGIDLRLGKKQIELFAGNKIDSSGEYVITISDEAKQALFEFMKGKKHNTSKVKLNKEEPMWKIESKNSQGQITSLNSKESYKDYLLSNVYNTLIKIPKPEIKPIISGIENNNIVTTEKEVKIPVYHNIYPKLDSIVTKDGKNTDYNSTQQYNGNIIEELNEELIEVKPTKNQPTANTAESGKADLNLFLADLEDTPTTTTETTTSTDDKSDLKLFLTDLEDDTKSPKDTKVKESVNLPLDEEILKTGISKEELNNLSAKEKKEVLDTIKKENSKPISTNSLDALKDDITTDDDTPIFKEKRDNEVEYDIQNLSEAEKWVMDKLPAGIEFKTVYRIKNAYGMLERNAIVLAEDAISGTHYHEAFHVVSQMILTSAERNNLYAEYRKLHPDLNIANDKIEEVLADEYTEYEAGIPKNKLGAFIVRMFNKIKTFINNFVYETEAGLKDEIFDKLSSGKYKNANLKSNPKTLHKSKKTNVKFNANGNMELESTKFFKDTIESVNKLFLQNIRNKNGSFSILETKTLEKEVVDSYTEVKSTIFAKYIASKVILRSNPKNTEYQWKNKALEYIYNNFTDEVMPAHSNFLNTLKIKINDEEGLLNKFDINEEEQSKDIAVDASSKSVELDPTLNASMKIKWLLATLPSTEQTSIGLEKGIDFQKAYGKLLANVKNINDLTDLKDQILKLSRKDKRFEYLLLPNGLDLYNVEDKLSNGTYPVSKFEELTQLIQGLQNTETNFLIELIGENGFRKFLDANMDSKYNSIEQEWVSASKRNQFNNEYSKFYDVNGNYNVKEIAKKFKYFRTDKGFESYYVDFLKVLGIDISKAVSNMTVDSKDLEQFRQTSAYILKGIHENGKGNTAYAKNNINILNRSEEETNSSGDLTKLLELNYKYSSTEVAMHRNSENKNIYNISKLSMLTKIADDINKMSFKELSAKYPQFNSSINPFIQHSILIGNTSELYSDGSRNSKKEFKINVIEESKSNLTNEVVQYKDLNAVDNFITSFHGFQNGMIQLVRMADMTLERYMTVPVIFKTTANDMPEIYKIFKGYLTDELNDLISNTYELDIIDGKQTKWSNILDTETDLSQKGVIINTILEYSKDKTFKDELKAFLNDIQNSEAENVDEFIEKYSHFVETAIDSFLVQETQDIFNYLYKNNLISKNPNGNWNVKQLSIKKGSKDFSTESSLKNLTDTLFNYITNHKIYNIEQFKVFFGNPAYYKDGNTAPKRFKSFGGTQKFAIDDPFINSYLDIKYPRLDTLLSKNKKVLVDNTLNTGKSITRTQIFEDVITDQIFKGGVNDKLKDAYKKMNETDGFSMVSFDFAREFLIKNSDWTFIGKNSHEALYQWEMQKYVTPFLEGLFKDNPNGLNDIFRKMFKYEYSEFNKNKRIPKYIESDEISYFLKNKPKITIPSLKPLYSGVLAEKGAKQSISKTSFNVLHPSLIFAKEGTNRRFPQLKPLFIHMLKNQLSILSFRSSNKGITTKVYNDTDKTNTLYDDKGNLNFNSSKLYQDTYTENWGIQVDTGFKPHSNITQGSQASKYIKSRAYEDGKFVIPEDLQTKHKELDNHISDYMDATFSKLLNDLSINELSDNTYKIENFDTFKEKILELTEGSDLSNNEIEAIEQMESTLALDGTLNSPLISSILFSLANKTVFRPKRNGMPAYQVASTFFQDTLTRDRVEGTGNFGHGSINFYDKQGDEIQDATVYIRNPYGDNITEVQMSKLLKDAIAYRIPTQDLNSIESVKLKFLPNEVGDIAIVASAIVKKTGSDFDIDKLFLELPNSYKTIENGKVVLKALGKLTYDEYIDIHNDKLLNFVVKQVKSSLEDSDVWYTANDDNYYVYQSIKDTVQDFTKEVKKIKDLDLLTELKNKLNSDLNKIVISAKNESVSDLNISKIEEYTIDLTENILNLNNETLSAIPMQEDIFNIKTLENRILFKRKEIISHPNNFDNLVNPLDDDLLPKLADKLVKDVSNTTRDKTPLYKLSNKLYGLELSRRFLYGKKSVSIYAIASTFKVMANMHDFKFNNTYKRLEREKKGLINFIPTSTRINLDHHSNEQDHILLGKLNEAGGNKLDISHVLSLWINAGVDATTDPFMFDMNVNEETISTMLFLTMAGVPVEQVAYFLNQPIIKGFVRENSLGKSLVYRTFSENNAPKSKNDILKDLQKIYGYGTINYNNNTKYSLENLTSMVKGEIDNTAQWNILSDFFRYKDLAGKMSTSMQGITYDTKGIGKSPAELQVMLLQTQLTLNDRTVNNEPILLNFNKILEKDNQLTGYLSSFYSKSKDMLNSLTEVFPLQLDNITLDIAKNKLLDIITNPVHSFNRNEVVALTNKLTNGFKTKMLTASKNLKIQGDVNRGKVIIEQLDELMGKSTNPLGNSIQRIANLQNLLYIGDKLLHPKITKASQNSILDNTTTLQGKPISRNALIGFIKNQYFELKDNLFIRKLSIIPSKDYNMNYDHIVIFPEKITPEEKNRMILEWENLLDQSNNNIKQIFIDLAKIGTFEFGYNKSYTQLMEFMPVSLHNEFSKAIGLAHEYHTKDINQQDDYNASKFLLEFFADNVKNSKLVPTYFREGFPFYKKINYKSENRDEREQMREFGINLYSESDLLSNINSTNINKYYPNIVSREPMRNTSMFNRLNEANAEMAKSLFDYVYTGALRKQGEPGYVNENILESNRGEDIKVNESTNLIEDVNKYSGGKTKSPNVVIKSISELNKIANEQKQSNSLSKHYSKAEFKEGDKIKEDCKGK